MYQHLNTFCNNHSLFLATLLVRQNMVIQQQLVNNPALPDMLKPAFQELATIMQQGDQVFRALNEDVVEGNGPVCRGMYATAQVLGLEKEREPQLKELRVCTDFRENPKVDTGAPGLGLLSRRLSKFFEATFPYELFAANEENGTLTYNIVVAGYAVEIRIHSDKVKDSLVRVKEIALSIHSKFRYWSVFQRVTPYVAFADPGVMKLREGTANHTLEVHHAPVTLNHQEQMWHTVMDLLEQKLGFTFTDYVECGESWQETLNQFWNELDVYEDKGHIEEALFATVRNNHRSSQHNGHLVETSFGKFRLSTNFKDKYSYSDVLKAKKDSPWSRDRAVVTLEDLSVGGKEMSGGGNMLPLEYHQEFKQKLREWLDAALTEVEARKA